MRVSQSLPDSQHKYKWITEIETKSERIKKFRDQLVLSRGSQYLLLTNYPLEPPVENNLIELKEGEKNLTYILPSKPIQKKSTPTDA